MQSENHDGLLDNQNLPHHLDEMKRSMSSVREVIRSLQEKHDTTSELDFKDGISLLTVKSHVMLSYLQSLVLVTARRALGHSLTEKSPPAAPFSALDRESRGAGAGDRVDAMIEGRVILEKIKLLESRMKYQIDKLVRVAEESPEATQNVINDPLAFRPNPENLVDQESSAEEEGQESADDEQGRDAIYRPPKLAPMPYTEPRKDKDRSRRAPVPSTLSALARVDPSMPYIESTSGLGSTPSLTSGRARELQRMTEFEEENMTRLVMKKKDAKKRLQDEADIALGGIGAASNRRGRGGGLDDEFGDILKSVGRSRTGAIGDGYEELRQKGKKASVLARSRTRSRGDELEDGGVDGPRQRKRSRFEKEVKSARKRQARS